MAKHGRLLSETRAVWSQLVRILCFPYVVICFSIKNSAWEASVPGNAASPSRRGRGAQKEPHLSSKVSTLQQKSTWLKFHSKFPAIVGTHARVRDRCAFCVSSGSYHPRNCSFGSASAIHLSLDPRCMEDRYKYCQHYTAHKALPIKLVRTEIK